MNQEDYIKLLEEVTKRAKQDDYDLEGLVNRTDDLVDDTYKYRDLMENAAGNIYGKNTGVNIPNLKTASRNDIERMTRDLIEENYGSDLGLNIRALDDIEGRHGFYTPSKNEITLNKKIMNQGNVPESISTALHEAGHAYDKQSGLYVPSEKVEKIGKSKMSDLKDLGVSRGSQGKLRDIDEIGEILQKGHHLNLPERTKSWGRSALENLIKNRAVKSVPLIGPAIGVGAALMAGEASAGIPILNEADNLGSTEYSLEYKLESGDRLNNEERKRLSDQFLK